MSDEVVAWLLFLNLFAFAVWAVFDVLLELFGREADD